jgi:hypothetical protein
LGELTGAACATLVAEMAERHTGPLILVAPDMQNALLTGRRCPTTASHHTRR